MTNDKTIKKDLAALVSDGTLQPAPDTEKTKEIKDALATIKATHGKIVRP